MVIMQADVRQVLADVNFLREKITHIRFWFNDKSFTESFPSIATWRQGDVSLKINGDNDDWAEFDNCMNRYGIQPQPDGKGFYKFNVSSDHDIIAILYQALSQQRVYAQARQLANLHQEIEQTAHQLPHVRPSVFSRGVNALKNQVQVLENIRKIHLQQYQK